MKPFICLSCEGNDTKVVVVSNENEEMIVESVFSVGISPTSVGSKSSMQSMDLGMEEFSDDINFESLGSVEASTGTAELADINTLAAQLAPYNLNAASFIPVLTDPSIGYHIYEGDEQKSKKKMLEAIALDILKSKNLTITLDSIDYIKLDERMFLCVYIEGELPGVNIVDSLAKANFKKRPYKITAMKSAEVALANYVSKTTKFHAEDYSLIIYTGKDYSKLIFLQGQQLKHIGTTLDIGTQNLHTYDVYFSKILLEMENGGIPRLDNVVLCGDDKSENLILSFYGTFPEANVSELKFDSINTINLKKSEKENLSAFAIPLATMIEFFESPAEESISLVPKFIREKQKTVQFGWHSYAVLLALFAVTFGVTVIIQTNNQELDELTREYNRLETLQKQNQEISMEINTHKTKISEFDKTQAILDSASYGTEVWGSMLEHVSDFIERRRNFWVTQLTSKNINEVSINGMSLSRTSLTEFTDFNHAGLLKNVLHEQIRERNAFSYSLSYKLFEEN